MFNCLFVFFFIFFFISYLLFKLRAIGGPAIGKPSRFYYGVSIILTAGRQAASPTGERALLTDPNEH